KTVLQKFGRAKRGHCCVQRRQFIRGERVSVLPAININRIVAYNVIPGSVTPENAFDKPLSRAQSIIILDNCNIHHAEEVRELIEDCYC
ncbi:hypothetical protein BT96DRAFT_759715, partial [Gymnopus androsaceus JB14]